MRYHIVLSLILIWACAVRVVWLDRFPVSLYTDEANQLYNARSLWQTGKDEHNVSWPVSLRSFGDWKPPLQTYLMIPFVASGFSHEYSARLPGVFLGVSTVYLCALFFNTAWKIGKRASLLSAFFLAVSPWHILHSRSAMLVAPTLFFFSLGVYGWIQGRRSAWWFFLGTCSFALSVYGYYAMRVVVPLMVIYLFWRGRQWIVYKKYVWVSGVVACLILAPLLMSFFVEPDVVFGRARTVSIFYDQGVRLRQWELITQDGVEGSPMLSRFFHTGGYLFSRDIVRRFFSHFDIRYLFLFGDTVQPFQISGMGILYLPELFAIPLGIYWWIKRKKDRLVIWWLIIATIPAALTYLAPSSNRTFFSVVPYMMFVAYGFSAFRRFSVSVVLSCLYIVFVGYFLYQYIHIMPAYHAAWWNDGWNQVAAYIKKRETSYETIMIFDQGGMPYIYMLLEGLIDPFTYQTNAHRTYQADRFGFEHVEGVGKYVFPSDLHWKDIREQPLPRTLYVVPGRELVGDESADHVIYYPDGQVMAKILSYE